MEYCNIKRPSIRGGLSAASKQDAQNLFNKTGDEFKTIGDKILSAIEFGAQLDNSAVVTYDNAESDDIDMMSSPNHDFFDIADEVGATVARQQVSSPNVGDTGDNQTE